MLGKLGAYRQRNRLYLALGETGRIERTPFMLEWIERPELRMACRAGLSKSEARHTLARAAQKRRVMALNLVIAAIVYWNTCHMDKAAACLRRQGRLPDPNLLRYVSPLGWYPIGLTGDYNRPSGAAERMNARPLNLHPARIRA